MIELTGRRNRRSSPEFHYKLQVCGFYMALFSDGGKSSSYLDVVRDRFSIYSSSDGPEAVSVHAFDKHGNFSHVVDMEAA